MHLFGEKGSTGERKLDTSANDFERGKVKLASMCMVLQSTCAKKLICTCTISATHRCLLHHLCVYATLSADDVF